MTQGHVRLDVKNTTHQYVVRGNTSFAPHSDRVVEVTLAQAKEIRAHSGLVTHEVSDQPLDPEVQSLGVTGDEEQETPTTPQEDESTQDGTEEVEETTESTETETAPEAGSGEGTDVPSDEGAEQVTTETVQTTDTEPSVPLDSLTVADLKAMAKEAGVTGYSAMNKDALVEALS